MSYSNNNKE